MQIIEFGRQIKGMTLRQVWDFCEDTGGELENDKGFIRVLRVYIDA